MTFDKLYKGASVGEKGTLFQLKERFDRKNAKKMVKQAVNPCRDLMNFVTYGYIVLAAMHVLRITDKDETPNVGYISDIKRKEHMEYIASKIVQMLIALDVKMPPNIEENSKQDKKKRKLDTSNVVTVGVQSNIKILA